jgi:DNA-binding Lrp family transcriptional regulator
VRISYAELARAVNMSPSAVKERVRRLEEVTGRISGLGSVTTSVVYSSPLTRRALTTPEPTASSRSER